MNQFTVVWTLMMLLNFTEERQSKDGTLEKRIGNIFLQNFDNNGP